ncbi:MAG: two-component system sensor histidine kinase BaeS [Paraglaciecola sp.]|jgi:two-component system sensor histidine kinase BaeS
MNIFRKVFLSFLGLTALTLLITLGLARWSFDQGFLNFVAGLEQQRLSILGDKLSDIYLRDNSWQRVVDSGLETYLSPGPSRPGGEAPALSQPSPFRPTERRPGARPPHPRDRKNDAPPTALFDAHDQWLTGGKPKPDAKEVLSYALYVKGEKVGELRSWLDAIPERSLASSFAVGQRNTSIFIGLLCLLLAALASWLLARRLTAPVDKVLQGVERLSRGNFDVSLDTQRKDELGTLMCNLNNLSHILNETRSAQKRWFADISHELRTPLTILIGELDALEAGIRPFGPEQVASLKHESLLLHRLVDDLYQLSMSDVGGLKYHFNVVDITESIENVCAALSAKAQQKNLRISTNILSKPVHCLADPQRVEQLFINLLNNAILYTDGQGEIHISLIKSGRTVIFEINDTLPGVPVADCDKLFEPLYRQSTSRNRATSGAGLGLTICKNIVTAHQGKITATPSSLGGLCIRVEFVVAQE